VRYTDTVGFIRKLPHGLVASFRATLEEALDADVLLHVVDASHPEWEAQAQVVGEVLQEAGLKTGVPVVMVLNKCDRLTSEEREALAAEVARRGWEAVLVSAKTGEGMEGVGRCISNIHLQL
jgi:GTP-binding protein HflX